MWINHQTVRKDISSQIPKASTCNWDLFFKDFRDYSSRNFIGLFTTMESSFSVSPLKISIPCSYFGICKLLLSNLCHCESWHALLFMCWGFDKPIDYNQSLLSWKTDKLIIKAKTFLPLASQKASEILTICMSAPSREQLAVATPHFTRRPGCYPLPSPNPSFKENKQSSFTSDCARMHSPPPKDM